MAMAGPFWIGEGSLYDVPVRSGVRRPASVAFDAAYVMVTWDGELPPAFSVEAATAEETDRVDVLTAVTGGIHLACEYDLSTTLLQRLADGGAEIGDLLTHRSARRHRLLVP
ncbi:hypothetical protein [Streptomyces violaceus]|uniref:Uncharacterized protein n=1 Tax=Streptomyces violaceus TaxID=1936 RepID=A0ABY9UJ46_STRVL|nr:hypothetical protein [Streptomyces janthinus]WND22885.1 hypothetical protein RI060_38490 [Streptomyces janthinus]GGS53968.1 hypothetical protein GCM10010270_25370 [Streptomyces janthinus]